MNGTEERAFWLAIIDQALADFFLPIPNNKYEAIKTKQEIEMSKRFFLSNERKFKEHREVVCMFAGVEPAVIQERALTYIRRGKYTNTKAFYRGWA